MTSSRAQKVLIRTDEGATHECLLRPGQPIIIGRGKDAGVLLDFKSVSRQHCRLELDEAGRVELVDLGSQNGTRVNGKRVDRAVLKPGDEVMVATIALRVEVVRPPDRPRFDTERHLSPEEKKLRRMLADMGLDVKERIDLGSAVPVYRAHRRDLEQDVLVKAVQVGDLPEQAEAAQRLLRAAKIAARMRHRNIAQVHDVRQFPGVVAIVLEMVDGRTLQNEIARRGVLDPLRALQIGIEICSALEHAHEAGVVHRNITPGAIMIAKSGEVKVVDFGLAKSLAAGRGGQALTVEGQALGDVEYSPPEQVRDATAVDPRADIFALGATLYHALSGEPPRIQVTPQALQDQLALVPPRLAVVAPKVPEVCCAAVERAMAARREDRWQTAGEFRQALEAARARLEAASAPPPPAAFREPAETAIARFAPAGKRSGTGFVGRIQTDELVELLQMVEYNRKSGVLEIYGTAGEGARKISGAVAFREGAIVEARAGEHRGSEALFELLLLPSGNFRVLYGERPKAEGEQPLNISATIMEVLRRKDEAKGSTRDGGARA